MANISQFDYVNGEKIQSSIDAANHPTAYVLSQELASLLGNQKSDYIDWNTIRTKLREIIVELNAKVREDEIISTLNTLLGSSDWQIGETTTIDWSNIQNKPPTFAPTPHTHPASNVDFGTGTDGHVWTSDGAGNESWQPAPGADAGSGDMTKAVYDPDDDGKVNSAVNADVVPWSGVSGKPPTFTPDPHTHQASEVDFGTGTNGYVWTSDGEGNESWQPIPDNDPIDYNGQRSPETLLDTGGRRSPETV